MKEYVGFEGMLGGLLLASGQSGSQDERVRGV